jgi:alkylation response protein AidB-like acyl-CoA dehydrogenase
MTAVEEVEAGSERRFAEPADAVAAAAELVPLLRSEAIEGDRSHRLTDTTMAALRSSGLLMVASPVAFGGSALGLDTAFAVVRELGHGSASAGWVACQYILHNWAMARHSSAVQEMYFAADPDVTCATALALVESDVEPVDGGLRVSGRWKFASGIDGADWLWIMKQTADSWDGLLVPQGEFDVVDNWNVIGLQGTGSKDVALRDALIPSARVLPVEVQRLPAQPGQALYDDDPTHRLSGLVWGPWAISPLLGSADEMVRVFTEALGDRTSSLTGRPSRENQLLQAALAEASVEVACANLLFETDMLTLRARADAGTEIPHETVAEVGLHAAYACRLMLQAGRRLFEAGGSSVIYDDNPLGRLVRDIIAGTRHAIVNWEENAERFGRSRLGLEPLVLRSM